MSANNQYLVMESVNQSDERRYFTGMPFPWPGFLSSVRYGIGAVLTGLDIGRGK
jgi:hypothetical protein